MEYRITILGMVQGVGFRPYVASIADKLDIIGNVCNCGGMVVIECSTQREVLEKFIWHLRFRAPKGAIVQQIKVEKKYKTNIVYDNTFKMKDSSEDVLMHVPIIPPDIGICDACSRELKDPQNRRYGYPFISCALCGPRYSILERMPYDRENTSMDEFEMCDACQREYTTKIDRRCHAQTISCAYCGPQLLLTQVSPKKRLEPEFQQEEALFRSITILQQGGVLALKGVGGYLFCCKIEKNEAIHKIRKLKKREKKPFAVMFASIEQIKEYCILSQEEETLLLESAAPIVLLQKGKKGKELDNLICGESNEIGAFLAYTGLHILLVQACGPLVMTSANRTAEPIIASDEEMYLFTVEEKEEKIDAITWNRRKITAPLDDSVCRVVEHKRTFLRRSRGYVPLPIFVKHEAKDMEHLLAFGGDLKAAFAIGAEEKVYVSQFFGDFEDYRSRERYLEQLTWMSTLLHSMPEMLVCDMHPGYRSRQTGEKWSKEKGIPLCQIQHHYAHIASVMAEHDISDCIGVALDGTGYGIDEAIWGGEFLVCDKRNCFRAGHLSYVETVGGDATEKDAEVMEICELLGMAEEMKENKIIWQEAWQKVDPNKKKIVQSALLHHVQTLNSSSVGRLFDSVCALLGIKYENSYEGECAIALEHSAQKAIEKHEAPIPLSFPIIVEKDGSLLADRKDLIRQLLLQKKVAETSALALGFHEAVSKMILEMCEKIRKDHGKNVVALSGGVFTNKILLSRTITLLKKASFYVYWNEQVPFNDGGISLGQLWIAKKYAKAPENKFIKVEWRC